MKLLRSITMEIKENKYCRFCAEKKSLVVNWDIDTNKHSDIIKKMSFVNAVYVNIKLELLPKTVCFVCYESLNKAYEFLERVKHAQDVLFDIIRVTHDRPKTATKSLISNIVLEEFESDIEIKIELTTENSQSDNDDEATPTEKELTTENSQSDDNDDEATPTENNNQSSAIRVIEQSSDVQDIENNEQTLDFQDFKIGKIEQLSDIKENDQLSDIQDNDQLPDIQENDHLSDIQNHQLSDIQENDHLSDIIQNNHQLSDIENNEQPSDIENKDQSSDSDNHDIENNDQSSDSENHDIENNNQSLDVQDVIDAVVNSSGTSKTIYAKEVTNDISTEIESWEDYMWTCGLCNAGFQDLRMLRMHTRADHKMCAAFACGDCKRFNIMDSFIQFIGHVKRHHQLLRRLCYICDEPLETSQKLSYHISKYHHSKESEVCEMCGDILHTLEEKLDHDKFKVIKPRTIDLLTCNICKKVFKSTSSLKAHERLHSERKRDFICDRCGKSYFNKGQLVDHIKVHDGIKPYACKLCNLRFLVRYKLKKHVLAHSGVKSFTCEQCGKTFREKYQLNNHLLVHTDILPFSCKVCDKRFRHKNLLQCHVRQHTGEKPYQCKVCLMEFSNWANCNKHMKRKHGKSISKKIYTSEGFFPLNPETGQIIRVEKDDEIKEWERNLLQPPKKGRKKGKKVLKKKAQE